LRALVFLADAFGFFKKRGNFVLREVTPAAAGDVREADVADAGSGQALDAAADGGEHPAHLSIAALEDGQLDLAAAGAVGFLGHLGHPHILRRLRDAVLQLNARVQLRQAAGFGHAPEDRFVRFADMVLGVCDLVDEVAVVGEEDQALRVDVEAADGAQEGLLLQVDVVDHGPSGMRVAHRAGDAARFVQRDIVVACRGLDLATVEDDLVNGDVYLGAKLLDGLAVDRDPALFNQILATATRRDPGCRQDLLQPFLHIFFHP